MVAKPKMMVKHLGLINLSAPKPDSLLLVKECNALMVLKPTKFPTHLVL